VNAAFGTSCLTSNTTGNQNCGFGAYSLQYNTTASSNSGFGAYSLQNNTVGGSNSAFGRNALQANTTGSFNTALGVYALDVNVEGTGNTALGAYALHAGLSGSSDAYVYTTGVGYNAQVSASNQVQLGSSSTTTYCYGAVQNRSDIRDKTDVRDTVLGLDFICALRAVDYKWDMRDDYRPAPDGHQEPYAPGPLSSYTHDGTKKRTRYHHGLIAQEVRATMEALGVDFGGFQNHAINGGDDVMSLGYTELIAPLIKATQELRTKVQGLTENLQALQFEVEGLKRSEP
jgi:hypothetical protein